MSTTLDSAAMAAALKELYNGQNLKVATYQDNPFLAMVPKDTDFGGSSMPLPLRYNNSQGRSTLFANAQAQQQAPQLIRYSITTTTDYSVATFQNKVAMESKGSPKAFISAAKVNADSARDALISSLASALYRDGTGVIGVISTIGAPTAGIIVLADPSSVTQFEVGMTLQANAYPGGVLGATRAGTGYVVAVDRDAATITVALSQGGAPANPAGWVATDAISVVGDLNGKVKGLAAWIPFTAPTAAPFFGVDRTADTVRLGGVRSNGSSKTIEEALIDASSRLSREGGLPKHCFMSFESYAALLKGLTGKVQYIDEKLMEGRVSFQGVKINGQKGPITVFPDRNCPGLTAYLLELDSWKFWSSGDAPQILTYDLEGLSMLRVANADAMEMRFGYYGQLACDMPGHNAVVSLSE